MIYYRLGATIAQRELLGSITFVFGYVADHQQLADLWIVLHQQGNRVNYIGGCGDHAIPIETKLNTLQYSNVGVNAYDSTLIRTPVIIIQSVVGFWLVGTLIVAIGNPIVVVVVVRTPIAVFPPIAVLRFVWTVIL